MEEQRGFDWTAVERGGIKRRFPIWPVRHPDSVETKEKSTMERRERTRMMEEGERRETMWARLIAVRALRHLA